MVHIFYNNNKKNGINLLLTIRVVEKPGSTYKVKIVCQKCLLSTRMAIETYPSKEFVLKVSPREFVRL